MIYTRDVFAGIHGSPAFTAAFAAETEVLGITIDLDDVLGSPESIDAMIVGTRTAGSPSGNGIITASLRWQEADDTGFTAGVQDVQDHPLHAAVAIDLSAGNPKFYIHLPLNLQKVAKRFIRLATTIAANAADTHSSQGLYLFGGHQQRPVAQYGIGHRT